MSDYSSLSCLYDDRIKEDKKKYKKSIEKSIVGAFPEEPSER
jgi:hypothetical protein